jgi:hypothetical protein
MKTKEELSKLTINELVEEAKALKLRGYSDMNKQALVTAIVIAQRAAAAKEAAAAIPAAEPGVEYTDCDENPIGINDTVDVRINNKHFTGIITGLKVIEEDQYAHVLLESQDKSKMFHTGDVKFISKGEAPAAPAPKPVTKKAEKKVIKDISGNGNDAVIEPAVAETPVPTEEQPTTQPEEEKFPTVKEAKKKEAKPEVKISDVDCIFGKGDEVVFMSAKNSKKAPNKELEGTVVSLKEGRGKVFLVIKVEGLGIFLKESSKCRK